MERPRWQTELAKTISDEHTLSEEISLTQEELSWFRRAAEQEHLRFQLPQRYRDLIDDDAGACDPIRLQAIPSIEEFTSLSCETADPLSEERFQLTDRLVRRYKSRAVFLSTDACAMYCRHCFRRRFTGRHQGAASEDEILEAASVLKDTPEIRELLISGGDPLIMTDRQIEHMIGLFREARPDLVLRIGTRIPVVLPSRITEGLLSVLRKASEQAPVYMMLQINHPREIDGASAQALKALSDAGILLFDQTVLLKGVNDDVDTLEELMNLLVSHRVTPYYLFQGDLASGTSHLRVPLYRGYEIEDELRKRLSGLAMPQFAVDLPNGGGKVRLQRSSLIRQEEHRYLFLSMDGIEIWYTDVED